MRRLSDEPFHHGRLDHGGQRLVDGLSLRGRRGRRVAEVGLLAAGLAEALRTLPDHPSDADVDGREETTRRLVDQFGPYGHHQRRLVAAGVTGSRTELAGELVGPATLRLVGKQDRPAR